MLRLGRAGIVFEQQVLRGEQLLCTAPVKIACVNQKTLGPTAMPAPIRQAVARQVGSVNSEE